MQKFEIHTLDSQGPAIQSAVANIYQKLGQVSGITSIPEVERSIDSSTSIVYRPLALSNQPLKNSLQIG